MKLSETVSKITPYFLYIALYLPYAILSECPNSVSVYIYPVYAVYSALKNFTVEQKSSVFPVTFFQSSINLYMLISLKVCPLLKNLNLDWDQKMYTLLIKHLIRDLLASKINESRYLAKLEPDPK